MPGVKKYVSGYTCLPFLLPTCPLTYSPTLLPFIPFSGGLLFSIPSSTTYLGRGGCKTMPLVSLGVEGVWRWTIMVDVCV